MSPSGFFRICRPANSLVAGLAAIVAYLIATGTVVPAALLLFVIVALITAAGNVINDYYDVDIDMVNRQDRPIPSGTVTRGAALRFAVLLFLAGIAVSLFVVAIAALNLVLDFDFIEQGVNQGAPKFMEWYGAFGIMVTLVWLYLEIIRLLSKLRSRNN